MIWSDYWNALSSRQRIGLGAGAMLIVIATIALAVWLLRDPYVPLAAGLSAERVNEMAQALDRAKLRYRISEGGDALTVPESRLGESRAVAAAGALDLPQSVGLELFKETDFSATDFAQKVNYQRALQGELTRTIQTIAGVRSARVHVILPDGGLFKRNAAKATAAISVAMQSGKALTRAQVLGIQRLVVAAVPEIRIEDVVVLDESGASLTRASGEGDLSSAQLDLKRQADQYLEGKVLRLLQDLAPQGVASVSVDTTLDDKHLRVTTEEPIGARGVKATDRAAGVLVKERQSQRGPAAGLVHTDGYGPQSDSADYEYEYKVGNRIEQTQSGPGSIKRVSVAVALQRAPAHLAGSTLEDLVAHAVGIDRTRGDSVAVLVVPDSQATIAGELAVEAPSQTRRAAAGGGAKVVRGPGDDWITVRPWAIALLCAAMLAGALWWMRSRHVRASLAVDIDEETVMANVRQWLSEGRSSGRV